MTLIPDCIYEGYRKMADAMINELGVNCKLVYPPVLEDCDNCVYDPIGDKSSGRYKSGGPRPFYGGACPVCKGAGTKEIEDTETVKFRFYNQGSRGGAVGLPSDFLKIGEAIRTAEGAGFLIGFIYDLPKLEQANEIIINSDQENYKKWVYTKATEAVPYGLQKNRYFIVGVERVDG